MTIRHRRRGGRFRRHGLPIRLDVEVGKHEEEYERVQADPVAERHRVVAVGQEEQLRSVNADEQKLSLSKKTTGKRMVQLLPLRQVVF